MASKIKAMKAYFILNVSIIKKKKYKEIETIKRMKNTSFNKKLYAGWVAMHLVFKSSV